MQLGMIGLGRMRANMVRRLRHEIPDARIDKGGGHHDGGNSHYIDDIRRAKELAPA